MAESQPMTMNVDVSLIAVVTPESDVGGFSAEVPALEGCYTQGETLEVTRERVREAIELWLSVAHDERMERNRQIDSA